MKCFALVAHRIEQGFSNPQSESAKTHLNNSYKGVCVSVVGSPKYAKNRRYREEIRILLASFGKYSASGFGQNKIFHHHSDPFLDCLWVVGEVGEEDHLENNA